MAERELSAFFARYRTVRPEQAKASAEDWLRELMASDDSRVGSRMANAHGRGCGEACQPSQFLTGAVATRRAGWRDGRKSHTACPPVRLRPRLGHLSSFPRNRCSRRPIIRSRSALGEGQGGKRYIVSVPGRGYRFSSRDHSLGRTLDA